MLLIVTFCAETYAIYSAVKYRNNMVVYHVFNPIQFLIISLYFNESIPSFKRKNIGWYIGILGVIASILNILFFQPLNTSNYYFLVFESLIIVFMALYSFIEMFLNENNDLIKNQHFWISFILLSFWSITLTYWAMHEIIDKHAAYFINYIAYILVSVNILTYLGLGTTLFLTSKQISQFER